MEVLYCSMDMLIKVIKHSVLNNHINRIIKAIQNLYILNFHTKKVMHNNEQATNQ